MSFYGWAPPPIQMRGQWDWLGPAIKNWMAGSERTKEAYDLKQLSQGKYDDLRSRRYGSLAAQAQIQQQMQRQWSPPVVLPKENPYKQPEGTIMQYGPLGEIKFITPDSPGYRAISTGDVTSVFDPRTGGIETTEHPSAKVSSTTVNIGKASPAERTAIAETNASIDALNNLKKLYDNVKTKTGPIAGRITPVLGLAGLTTKEQEDMMAATFAFQNAIIKEITGAQMSEVEANRIKKQIPLITDPPARWEAKWEQSYKNLEMLQKRRKEVLGQSGIRPPGVEISNKNIRKSEDPLGLGL